jgi:transketolase
MPTLRVFRPADAVETVECWELALIARNAPSVLALTRQGLPTLRRDWVSNRSAMGAYVLAEAEGARAVTLLATGSEVALALAAQALLAADGIAAAVVSMPCWELFDECDDAYRAGVLGDAPRLAIEAAAPFGWERYVGERGLILAMPGFGASAPAETLFDKFGFSPEAIADAARTLLGGRQ